MNTIIAIWHTCPQNDDITQLAQTQEQFNSSTMSFWAAVLSFHRCSSADVIGRHLEMALLNNRTHHLIAACNLHAWCLSQGKNPKDLHQASELLLRAMAMDQSTNNLSMFNYAMLLGQKNQLHEAQRMLDCLIQAMKNTNDVEKKGITVSEESNIVIDLASRNGASCLSMAHAHQTLFDMAIRNRMFQI